MDIGSRIGAIMSLDCGIVSLLGYGVYEGEGPVEPQMGGLAPLMWANPKGLAGHWLRTAVLTNPRGVGAHRGACLPGVERGGVLRLAEGSAGPG